MDSRLRERLNAISNQIKKLYTAESLYLTIHSAKDHTLAVMMANSSATSQAAKESEAKSSPDWKTFVEALALAEAEFHRQKHILDLVNNAYLAEHLSFKIDSDAIRKGVD